jgi:putative transposase
LLHLRELAGKLDCDVHAYCLMTNHVHLLVTPSAEDSCAMLMRHLGQRYVQYFNRRYGRSGTLWEGRYHSCVAESSSYVLACYRYIEMNPVRAGMVEHPSQYSWSSYNANSGGRTEKAITPHSEYLALGSEPSFRWDAYRSLFLQGIDTDLLEAIRSATNGGYPLGSESFRHDISSKTGRRTEAGKAGRPLKTS